MIDIKILRENPGLVRENLKKKFQHSKLHLVDDFLRLDEEWRKNRLKADNLRAQRNKLSLAINEAKKKNADASKLLSNAKELPNKISLLEEKDMDLQDKMSEVLCRIPNLIHESVPIGKDSTQNVIVKTVGRPREADFEIKGHAELGETLGVLDFDTSRDTSGNGFYFMKGKLALLNMALINFARDVMVRHGFTYVEPPLMIRKEILTGVYSNAEIEAMAYKVENENLYLIATSEHPLIGQFIGKTLTKDALPVLQTGYSMCFRREIGSHGIDEKGIFRTHQFNKQEMIVICEPGESYEWYAKMLSYTEEIFKALEIPYRIVECCSGDLADLKAKSCDIEVYSPRQKGYFEATSLTNMEEAQARRLNIKIDAQGKKFFAHTLNNTVIATSRALVAIMENHQQKDGSIKIPRALQKYAGFDEIIKE